MSSFSRRSALAALALTPLTLAACSSNDTTTTGSGHTSTPAASTSSIAANHSTVEDGTTKKSDVPTKIVVSSIGLNKPVVNAGLNKNGNLEPPKGIVQWYNATVSPGAVGNSVIAGHVTYDDEPDAFYKLHTMKPGDKVVITYADGRTKQFVTERGESVDKEKLRTRQDVWGKKSTPELVLVTCDADSVVVGQHHVNNYVVWAKPVA